MKRLILFITMIFIPVWAVNQDKKNDLFLSDRAFEYKYIEKMTSIQSLMLIYQKTRWMDERILVLKRLTSFLENDRAFSFILEAISNNIPAPRGYDRNWMLRASAIYSLGLKGGNLTIEKRLRILKLTAERFKNETKPRVVATCVSTLIKLAIDPPDKTSLHKLFNQRKISYLLSERLLKLRPHENTLCLILVNGTIELGDQNSYLALVEARKRPFHPKVLARVQKAMDALNPQKIQ